MRLVGFCGTGAASLFLGIAWYLAALEPNVVRLQLAFTPTAFGNVVHAWTPESLQRYRAHFPADFVLIVAYSSFGFLLATRTTCLRALGAVPATIARWLLPVAGACDAAENLFHLWLSAAPRFGVPGIYALSATCSSLKWLGFLAFAALVLWALARAEP